MHYDNILPAVFLSRPNRFVAKVLVEGREETVHVKNTGRCRELLVPGCTVYLTESKNPSRKTRFDLVAVEKIREDLPPLLINMDAMAPNEAVFEFLSSDNAILKAQKLKKEVFFGASRFDLCAETEKGRAYIEVKGVTLERDGVALFPDAPTLRGVKHVEELCRAAKEGFGAYLFFVIQMKEIRSFSPNRAMHPSFAEALLKAKDCGVKLVAMDCIVTPDRMTIDAGVPICL